LTAVGAVVVCVVTVRVTGASWLGDAAGADCTGAGPVRVGALCGVEVATKAPPTRTITAAGAIIIHGDVLVFLLMRL
jgi:hypothetical protein